MAALLSDGFLPICTVLLALMKSMPNCVMFVFAYVDLIATFSLTPHSVRVIYLLLYSHSYCSCCTYYSEYY